MQRYQIELVDEQWLDEFLRDWDHSQADFDRTGKTWDREPRLNVAGAGVFTCGDLP